MGEMVCCVWHVGSAIPWVAWVKGFVMVVLAQWLFKFGKVMFGWNTWSVIGGMVAMVLHRYPYDNLFLPFHTWKKHYTHVPMTNHCNYAIMRNPFSHRSISPILLWQITSTMPLMTNHFISSIPENHGSYSTTTNHFTHSIDDISFIRN